MRLTYEIWKKLDQETEANNEKFRYEKNGHDNPEPVYYWNDVLSNKCFDSNQRWKSEEDEQTALLSP